MQRMSVWTVQRGPGTYPATNRIGHLTSIDASPRTPSEMYFVIDGDAISIYNIYCELLGTLWKARLQCNRKPRPKRDGQGQADGKLCDSPVWKDVANPSTCLQDFPALSSGSSAAPPTPAQAPPRPVRVSPALPSAQRPVRPPPPPLPLGGMQPNGWDDASPGQTMPAPAGGDYGSWGADGDPGAVLSALLPAASGGWGGNEKGAGCDQSAAARPSTGSPYDGWGGEEHPSPMSGPSSVAIGKGGAGLEGDAGWLVGSPEQPRDLSASAPLPANGHRAPGALRGSGLDPDAKPFVGAARAYNPMNPSSG